MDILFEMILKQIITINQKSSFLSELLHHICKGIATASISAPIVTERVALSCLEFVVFHKRILKQI